MNTPDSLPIRPAENGRTSNGREPDLAVIDLPSWDDFQKHVVTLASTGRYVWRGQRQAWPLRSQFDRYWKGRPSSRHAALHEVLQSFKHEMGQTHPQIRLGKSENVWWALGQHYGLKTPLLDWTCSPYIAAYFAFSEYRHDADDGYRYVYALDHKSLGRLIQKPSRSRLVEVIDRLEYPSPRFSVQRSLLTKALNGVDIETNVETYARKRPNQVLVRLRVPANNRRRCLRDLDLMNINYQTLLLDLRSVVDACNTSEVRS